MAVCRGVWSPDTREKQTHHCLLVQHQQPDKVVWKKSLPAVQLPLPPTGVSALLWWSNISGQLANNNVKQMLAHLIDDGHYVSLFD